MNIVGLVLLCLVPSDNVAQAPANKAEFRHDFRGGKLDTQAIELQGPADRVKLDAEGLRITLPGTSPAKVSASTRFGAQGDFEITVSFEIVKLEKPPNDARHGLTMSVALDSQVGPYIGRKCNADGTAAYIAGLTKGEKSDWVLLHTEASAGKMRVVRTGSTLRYFIADGESDEFRNIREADVGTADVRAVQLVLNNEESAVDAEVVLKTLTVRADKLQGPGLDAVASQPASGPGVLTIHDVHIPGRPTAIADGKLVVESDPPRSVPLDEVARITFAAAPQVGARWVGQDNHDVVQVGGATGGNGIQDMHIALVGLPVGRKIKQLVAVCSHPQRQGVWRLDTTGTPNWRAALERADGSDTADVYLEPNQDNFGQTFTITITYEDGTTAETTSEVTSHTDPQLKVVKGEAQPAPAVPSGPPRVLVHLEAGDRLRGELVELDKESLRLRGSWGSELDIPLVQVLGVEFGSSASLEARTKFADRLRHPAAEDTAIVRGPDEAVMLVSGTVEGMADGKLRFAYQGEARSINQPRLIGLVFSAHPPVRAVRAPYQIFSLISGDRISGMWRTIDSDRFGMETLWGSPIDLPAGSVSDITFRNGKMVYLSDLEPALVEEVPYFGRLMSYRRDQNLLGDVLRVKGKSYAKGLAVHSRCVLNYAIDGQFETFRAVVGFDESAGTRGRVACRVLGDGKELFAEHDLRADADSRPLELSIRGIGQLTLEVDFGEGEDTGDRVIWADPRIFRGAN